MGRDELLRNLSSLDFMAVDLALFLDTHPEATEAISEYNKIIRAADTVRAKYEENYGPLCSFRSFNRSEETFQWIDNPWPWEESFNFEMTKECE